MSKRTLCGGPVWFQPPGGGIGSGCERGFGGYFKTPVCGEDAGPPDPVPLFEEDFRSGPVGIEFPTTTTWWTSRGYQAPDHIWDFEESAVNTCVDHIGGYNLTPVQDAGTGIWPLQGRTAWGLKKKGTTNFSSKKCCEFYADLQHMLLLNDADTTKLDLQPGGVDKSQAWMAIVRGHADNPDDQGVPAFMPILGKIDANNGYSLGLYTGYEAFQLNYNAGAGAITSDTTNMDNMAWNCAFFGTNKTTVARWYEDPWGISGGAIPNYVMGNNIMFRIGYGIGALSSHCAAAQIAYLVCWEGAKAEQVQLDRANMLEDFWLAGLRDPSQYAGMELFDGSVNWGYEAGVIVNTPGQHVRIRESTAQDLAYDYASAFTHSSKIGGRFGTNYPTKCWTNTDSYAFASWNKTNLTASYATADLDELPMGTMAAGKLTATANGAMMYRAATTGAHPCVMGFFYKRHSSMGSNVTGHFRLKNLTTAAYEFDYSFTATAYWQWYEIEVTPANSGCQIEVVIDDNGDSICCHRVYGAQYVRCLRRNALGTLNNNGTWLKGTMPAIEAWCHADKGEIEVIFQSLRCDNNGQWRGIVDPKASDSDDRRAIVVNSATDFLGMRVYNNVGVANHTVQTLQLGFKDTHVLVAQWDNANPSLNGRYSRVFIDGVEYPGAALGWTIDGNRLSLVYIGVWAGSTAYELDTIISRVRIWSDPWQYMT